jgi:hypothetical protein
MGETNAKRTDIIAFAPISSLDFKFVNAITSFLTISNTNTDKCTLNKNILPFLFSKHTVSLRILATALQHKQLNCNTVAAIYISGVCGRTYSEQ